MKPTELKHLYRIVKVELVYGLDELSPEHHLTRAPLLARKSLWLRNQHADKALGDRLRLAPQELGHKWIKFGQMMSTRRDLFPPHIADLFAMLQDKVAPFDGQQAKQLIEKNSARRWKLGLMTLISNH